MKPVLLILSGLALIMAGCSKKAPVASTPKAPEAAPVAQTAPTRSQPRSTSNRQASEPQQVAETPRSTVMPAKIRDTLETELAKLEDALFDFDKTTIRPDAATALHDDISVIRDILAAYPSQKLVIEGHADERGSEEYNLALGDRRAQSVKDFLTQQGIPDAQLTLISYGKDRPVCTDDSEACWQRNRRAHVTAAQ